MSVPNVARLVRTLRHVTARQILWRAWTNGRLRVYDRVPAVAGLGLAAPARAHPGALAVLAGWVARKFPGAPSPRQHERAAEAAAGRFTFLGETLECRGGSVDWRAPGMSRLWRYNLHYGDHVAALALAARQRLDARPAERAWALVDDWIGANPPGRRPGWEPYPLSLRVANWATALGALAPAVEAEGRLPALIPSLAAQGRFLARHLEHHLGGNHLIKNARALLVLGLLFDDPEGARWRGQARTLLRAEVPRQVLEDGGHVERSPLYHALVLEDLLDCVALAGAAAPGIVLPDAEVAQLAAAARRMAGWLEIMTCPDGGLPLFNDCVEAGDPGPVALLQYAARVVGRDPRPGGPALALPASGYYVLQSGGARMVLDCGPIGPDELPAHAHADTLSFELGWGPDRVIVDSGTAEYAAGPLRDYVRGTQAHNTVRVDGVEQSEVWASHRVGRRARPIGARVEVADGGVRFTGGHDGYARLGVLHHRHVVALGAAWVIADELLGRGSHRFESFVHAHPAFRLERADGDWWLAGERLRLAVRPFGPVAAAAGRGWYCPDWGRVFPAPTLVLSGDAVLPVVFGYVLAPAGLAAAVQVSPDPAGVVVTGLVDGRAVQVRSARCTSSS